MYEFPSLVLEVRKDDVNKVAGKLIQDFPIDDINIAEQDIEDIIREIFENKND